MIRLNWSEVNGCQRRDNIILELTHWRWGERWRMEGDGVEERSGEEGAGEVCGEDLSPEV